MDEIDCADTEAVGLFRSRSPFAVFGLPLSLSIASWHTSVNQSSSGSMLPLMFCKDQNGYTTSASIINNCTDTHTHTHQLKIIAHLPNSRNIFSLSTLNFLQLFNQM